MVARRYFREFIVIAEYVRLGGIGSNVVKPHRGESGRNAIKDAKKSLSLQEYYFTLEKRMLNSRNRYFHATIENVLHSFSPIK